MLFLLSPAKTLDYESSALTDEYTLPSFLNYSQDLIDVLAQKSSSDIASLMGVSDKIAELNVQRYLDWSQPFTIQNAKQAVFAFKGDVYTGLSIESAGQDQIDYVQSHVRILSGLYGLLKPLDLMQAYRLEMGTKLENPKGKNLYEFWGGAITEKLNADLGESSGIQEKPVVVNLASNEYYKSVQPKSIEARIVTPNFKDLKNGQYKIISFYAKKARGLMVRFAADNNISNVEDLKRFDYEGYRFSEEHSKGDSWVFIRDEAPK